MYIYYVYWFLKQYESEMKPSFPMQSPVVAIFTVHVHFCFKNTNYKIFIQIFTLST